MYKEEYYKCKTVLDCIAEQRLCEVLEAGYETVEEWFDDTCKSSLRDIYRLVKKGELSV
jgi:hypothetical protein